jgi:membrane-associated phospholipid phosphatase
VKSPTALIGLVLVIAAAFAADDAVRAFVLAHQAPPLVAAARLVSRLTEWQWLMLACLPFLFAGWKNKRATGNAARLRCVVAVMLSATLAGLAADVVRGLAGRTRPAARVAQGWFGPRHAGRWVVADWDYNAFPSGHTATAAALVVAAALCNRRAGLVLAPLPLLVGASRVWVGAHHFSDIVAATVLGAFVAIAVSRRMKSPSSSSAPASENAVRR